MQIFIHTTIYYAYKKNTQRLERNNKQAVVSSKNLAFLILYLFHPSKSYKINTDYVIRGKRVDGWTDRRQAAH